MTLIQSPGVQAGIAVAAGSVLLGGVVGEAAAFAYASYQLMNGAPIAGYSALGMVRALPETPSGITNSNLLQVVLYLHGRNGIDAGFGPAIEDYLDILATP